MKRLLSMFALAAPLALCAQELNKPKLALRTWANGFDQPVVIAQCGDYRLFVCEKAGVIKIITDSMQVATRPFMDISDRVNSIGNEQGLLGMAFDPQFETNNAFYVYYIHGAGNGNSRVSRFYVTLDPDSADANSEQVIWEWPQPYTNHNGGDIHFDPQGNLVVGLGDGGSGNDPEHNGQDYTEPLGGLIRLYVSDTDTTYTIPPDNPFANSTGDTLPEISAVGLRNPWKFSFDQLTGDLWIGDVGQNAWEEVHFWSADSSGCPNFGWRCREGLVATPGVSQSGCLSASAYVSPVAVVSHGLGWQSVIGGYVYRGASFPHHYGHYIFTDYAAGDFLTFGPNTDYDVDTMLTTTTAGYAGFGEDYHGTLYVANQLNGQVRKIYDPCPMDAPVATSDGSVLTSSEADGYQWYYNGVAINGATDSTYTATLNGFYWVVGSFGNNCSLRSDTLTMITESVAELANGRIVLYPVPATDRIVLERAGAELKRTEVIIVDALGREAARSLWPSGEVRYWVDVSGLRDGTYSVLCRDQISGEVATTRMVVQR